MDQLELERTRNIEKLGPPARADQQKRQQQSQQVADSLQWNEAKTRALLIDAMLLQAGWDIQNRDQRSEEHTSELQSRGHLVCRLLLEKKKGNKITEIR